MVRHFVRHTVYADIMQYCFYYHLKLFYFEVVNDSVPYLQFCPKKWKMFLINMLYVYVNNM